MLGSRVNALLAFCAYLTHTLSDTHPDHTFTRVSFHSNLDGPYHDLESLSNGPCAWDLLQCRFACAQAHISAFHQEFQRFDYAYALWCGGQVFPSSARSEAVHSMAGRLGICLSCFAIVAASHADSLGAKGRLHGDDLAHSEYTLNLQPPEENAHDVEASLDATMKA